MIKRPNEELINRFLILSTDIEEEVQIEVSFQIKFVCLELNSDLIISKLVQNVCYDL